MKPKREGNFFLENRYKLTLMNYPNLRIMDVTMGVSDIAARLRADLGLKTPDAIILTSALSIRTDCFISNDSRLKSACDHSGIQLIGFGA